ncbi:MAG: acylphosphatase [Clostridia bacterium]|nr:acylphosphatase [Clostridia bacterium]
MTRKHIVFTGCVQGVGFRWRARQAANLYGCTGWVRNEWDGSVTMEIQGSEKEIDLVLRAINAGRYIEIERMDVQTIEAEPEERGFRTE